VAERQILVRLNNAQRPSAYDVQRVLLRHNSVNGFSREAELGLLRIELICVFVLRGSYRDFSPPSLCYSERGNK